MSQVAKNLNEFSCENPRKIGANSEERRKVLRKKAVNVERRLKPGI